MTYRDIMTSARDERIAEIRSWTRLSNAEIDRLYADNDLTDGQRAAILTKCPKCGELAGYSCRSISSRIKLADGRRSHAERTDRAQSIVIQTIGFSK